MGTVYCKDGQANINFKCKLGGPEQAHIQDGRQHHKKKKSATRVLKTNARAARLHISLQTPTHTQGSKGRSPPSASARPDHYCLEQNRIRKSSMTPEPQSSPPQPRETEQLQDISSLPSPQLSSPRREPGRPEITPTTL